MKTTIELPDAVVNRAKVLAAERRTTLRELVLQRKWKTPTFCRPVDGLAG
jgi:hypothetical protein